MIHVDRSYRGVRVRVAIDVPDDLERVKADPPWCSGRFDVAGVVLKALRKTEHEAFTKAKEMRP